MLDLLLVIPKSPVKGVRRDGSKLIISGCSKLALRSKEESLKKKASASSCPFVQQSYLIILLLSDMSKSTLIRSTGS